MGSSTTRVDARSKRAEARQLLRQGLEHYKADRWLEALEDFEAAYQVFPSPKLLGNIGAVYRKMGRPVKALEAYEKFVLEAGPTMPEARRKMEAMIEELKREVGALRAEAPAGTEVRLEGSTLGKTPFEAVRLKAGRYRVTLVVPERGSFEQVADIVAGQTTTVEPPLEEPAEAEPEPVLVLREEPPTFDPAPPPALLPAPEIRTEPPEIGRRAGPTHRWLAWGTAGAGVAFAGVGTFFGFEARDANARAQDCVDSRQWTPGCEDSLSRRDRYAPLAYTFIGVGAAAAVGGGIWAYLLHRKARRPSSAALSARVLRNGAAVTAGFVR